MHTLHHGFWIYFFVRRHPRVWHFVAGSMLPDYIYIVLVGVLTWEGKIRLWDFSSLSPMVFTSLLPLYPWAAQIDLLGHSIVVWGGAFALSYAPALYWTRSFIIGWGTHILIDSLTHAAHANFLFYPLSLFAVHSPVSYWDPQYFAREFKIVNGSLMFLAGLYLVHQWWKNRKN